jgi:hypothetical protein
MNFNNQACQQNTTKVETMKEEVESADVTEPPIALTDDVKPLEETGTNSVDVPAITSDVARLANSTPDYLLPFVGPIVETKLKTLSNFSRYRYFAQQEDIKFVNFPQSKQGIEAMFSVDLVKSGSFQDVASLKLVLLVLTESEGSIPFLKRPKIVDLKEAMSSLPLKFFQNLHSVVEKPGISVDKTLKPYRNGSTRSVVVQLENHFDQLDKILNKIQSRKVPLIKLASLNVSSSCCLLIFL